MMTYPHEQKEANTITLNAAINSCEEAGAWQVALPGRWIHDSGKILVPRIETMKRKM
jgi:hypothetical protein